MSKLAIHGGEPLRKQDFPVWPQYDQKESAALERVLKSGVWGTLGSEVNQFTERFAAYQQCKYGVSVTNGTVTLEIILRALGLGYGDEVILPPYTFIATASAVLTVGATPVFADIEPDTYNIDPVAVEAAITPRTKAIIVVHMGGRVCSMDAILAIAKKHDLYVVEDAAHAHGSEWKGQRVGSIGDAGSFSFQASKNLCAGEGGFISTNREDVYEKCWSIHHCGRDRKGLVWYEHPTFGTNARMTEWQAAILNTQMDRLDEQIEKRMENARYLDARLSQIEGIGVMKTDERITRNSYHLYLFRYLGEKADGLTRDLFLKALRAEGIPCYPGYTCLYHQPVFQGEQMKQLTGSKIPYESLVLENAEAASTREGVWLTQNLLLGERKDMDDIADSIIKVVENAQELQKD